jgi:hypothetical protein
MIAQTRVRLWRSQATGTRQIRGDDPELSHRRRLAFCIVSPTRKVNAMPRIDPLRSAFDEGAPLGGACYVSVRVLDTTQRHRALRTA